MPASFLPYGRQTIDDDDIAAVAAVLRSDFLTTGPAVEAFETAFAETVRAPHAVSCFNATVGLHLAMLALEVQPGDVVIVPSITFLSTANCVRMVGADVVFADVDADSGLMTPETFRQALHRAAGRRVAAVIPVHLRGAVVDIPGIAEIARPLGIAIVEDAAHAIGSIADWGPVGDCSFSDMAVFSFHPVKTMTTGEGGMVTTCDDAFADRLRLLRSHGMTRPKGAEPWVYEMAELGFNYRLPDINCALGLSQLNRLEDFRARRAAIALRYHERLEPLADRITLPRRLTLSTPLLHLFCVLIDFEAHGVSRVTVMERMKARGIGTQVHYIPVHTQRYYRALNPGLDLPGANAWYARTLTLPLFPGMAEGDPERVVDALLEALLP